MRVLVVCTGNICRSPVIEAALRERVAGLDTSSAGTRAVDGAAVHPLTAAAMAAHGLAAQGHRARLVGAGAVRGAELVITAERAHRAPVLALRPDLLRRTFTFAELVALAEAVSPGLAPGQEADALRAVVAGRGRYPVTAEDLPDPVDAGPAEHDLMVRTVLAGTDRLRAALTTGPGSISRA